MSLKLDNIYNLDCVKGMAKLPAGSIDLAFADPPFNIGYDYDIYDDRKAADDYLNWSRAWIESVVRVLKPNGTFWLAIGDEYAAELKVLCTRDLHLHCRSWVIWFYTFGVNCKQKFTRSHAHLFHFVKDAKSFTFNVNDIRVPSARQLVYGDKRAVDGGRLPDDTWMATADLPPETPMFDGFVLRPQDIPDRFPPHSDTWYFSRVAGTFGERQGWHGCQMPEQLLGRIIRASSNSNDVVLDPFGGSGTTLAVAKKLRRRFVGFEISEGYYEQIRQRLTSIDPSDPLVGPENPERSSPRTTGGRRLSNLNNALIQSKQAVALAIPEIAAPTRDQSPVSNGKKPPRSEITDAITRAFLETHDGYSLDRVVVDPELNEKFCASCERLRIPGSTADWNKLLLNVRKSKGLAQLAPTVRRTVVPFERLESFAFASEIAWRLLHNQTSLSLDELLADPKAAHQFDQIAKRIAPGYSPFEYRWAALAIRKRNGEGQRFLPSVRYKFADDKVPLDRFSRLPSSPAHYVIATNSVNIFAGFSENLNQCAFLSADKIESAARELSLNKYSERRVRLSYQLFNTAGDNRQRAPFWFARRLRIVQALNPTGNVVMTETAA